MSELMRLIVGIVATFALMLLIALMMSCIVAMLEAKKERKEKEVGRAFERIKQEEGLGGEEEMNSFKKKQPEEVKCHHIYDQYIRFYDAKRMCNTIHLKCEFCGEEITINVTDGVISDLFNDLDALRR